MPATISVNFTTQAEVLGASPPATKSVSASVLRSVLDTGGGGSGYVTVAGAQTITGAKTFSAGIAATTIAATTANVNVSLTVGVGPNGYSRLNNGNATKPGYLAWFTPDDVRRGYVGWETGDTENISFNLENGWGLNINSPSKPVVIDGDLQVTGNTTGIIPAGAVMAFGMNSAPLGWLICNGDIIGTSGTVQGVNASLLQTLRGLLGSSHGTTGSLPDLRGIFVRGSGGPQTVGGISYSGTFSVKQADAFKSHNHTITDPGHFHGVAGYAGIGSGNRINSAVICCGASGNTTSKTTGITINVQGGTETRPANIALLYCIKY